MDEIYLVVYSDFDDFHVIASYSAKSDADALATALNFFEVGHKVIPVTIDSINPAHILGRFEVSITKDVSADFRDFDDVFGDSFVMFWEAVYEDVPANIYFTNDGVMRLEVSATSKQAAWDKSVAIRDKVVSLGLWGDKGVEGKLKEIESE
jgi:hypothetical protein